MQPANMANIAETGVYINNHVDLTISYHESAEFIVWHAWVTQYVI